MSKKSIPSPGQEALIVVNEQTGLMQERPVNEAPAESASVDIVEHKLHLMNTLGQLAGASMRQGLLNAGEDAIRGRYGERAPQVIEGAGQERVRLLNASKESFARASGHYALIDAGVKPWRAKAVTRGLFSRFLVKYYRKYEASHSYLEQLGSEVEDLQTAVSTYNREFHLRPHKKESVTAPEEATADEKKDLQTLNARERSLAIMYDPRARFLPTHNRMRNFVMPLLDYLDNPEYPLGMNNQMFEVLVHQQKHSSSAMGIRAIESIAWEAGDYLAQSAKGYRLLIELKEAMSGVKPSVTLAEEFGDDLPALRHLIGFNAAKQFVLHGETAGMRDPLATKEERWVKQGTGGVRPGKHKAVHSLFTNPGLKAFSRPGSVEARAYLEQQVETMTIGQAQKIITEAIGNELNTARFMYRRLKDMSEIGDYRALEPVINAVTMSLEGVRDEPALKNIDDETEYRVA